MLPLELHVTVSSVLIPSSDSDLCDVVLWNMMVLVVTLGSFAGFPVLLTCDSPPSIGDWLSATSTMMSVG